MRLRCNMRFTFDGVTIHEVGEIIEKEYEEVKQAIRDRALIPLPDLPTIEAPKQSEPVNIDSKPSVVLPDTSEVKEG